MHSAPAADQRLLEAVRDVARAGGEKTLEWFRSSSLEVEAKADGTPVTQADKAAEHVVREAILGVDPQSSIVGEEHGSTQGDSNLVWYVDPIDGTKGFARGVPLYATLVAVSDEHGPAAGAIHIPATAEIVYAGRGLGCFTIDGPCQVSPVASLDGAVVTTSSVARWRDVYGRMVNAGAWVAGWGDGYGFLMVATGRADAMVDLHGGNPWDFAPMPVIMSEAGGRFSAPDGGPSFDGPSGIATNGVIHDRVLQVING